jgi:hypothetical protein
MVTMRLLQPEQDLPYLMLLEQEYYANRWIGCDSEDMHRARVADPGSGVDREALRECVWHGGRFRSLVVMSLLEGEAY